MQVEADIFLVFMGFNADTTGKMSIRELMAWHKIAIERYEKSQQK